MRQTLHIPRISYPWPTIPSPLADALDQEELTWIDEDYADFIPQESIGRMRLQHIARVGTYMNPTVTDIDRMRPACRHSLYITYVDDFFGVTPLDKFIPVRDRIFEVMMGADPRPGEIGVLRQMAAARREWSAMGMPQFWIERIAVNFRHFMTWGMMEEIPFRQSGTMPPIARLMLIRPYSIGMLAFGDMIEPCTDFVVPVEIYEHPVVKRLKWLLGVAIFLQNDLISIRKEMALEHETLNIVLVLQHERGLSLDDACLETLRMLDESMQEIVELHAAMPDFGPYRKGMDNYFHHIGLMISGCDSFYYDSGTNRYNAHGFVVPQYADDEVPTSVDVAFQ